MRRSGGGKVVIWKTCVEGKDQICHEALGARIVKVTEGRVGVGEGTRDALKVVGVRS